MATHKDYAHKLISVQKQIEDYQPRPIPHLQDLKQEIAEDWCYNLDLPNPSPYNDTTLVVFENELWEITIDEEMNVSVSLSHNLLLSGEVLI